jgi:hypothetical protein
MTTLFWERIADPIISIEQRSIDLTGGEALELCDPHTNSLLCSFLRQLLAAARSFTKIIEENDEEPYIVNW